jgi:hypothetical protein
VSSLAAQCVQNIPLHDLQNPENLVGKIVDENSKKKKRKKPSQPKSSKRSDKRKAVEGRNEAIKSGITLWSYFSSFVAIEGSQFFQENEFQKAKGIETAIAVALPSEYKSKQKKLVQPSLQFSRVSKDVNQTVFAQQISQNGFPINKTNEQYSQKVYGQQKSFGNNQVAFVQPQQQQSLFGTEQFPFAQQITPQQLSGQNTQNPYIISHRNSYVQNSYPQNSFNTFSQNSYQQGLMQKKFSEDHFGMWQLDINWYFSGCK